MIEEPLQFGPGGRLFGILTMPEGPSKTANDLPVFVILTSGLLHRVGPRRLYVRLARELAQQGFSSLRVDLAGRGDSSPSAGCSEEQSLLKDYEEIVSVLESRLGPVRLVLGGLCSAADDALRLAPGDSRITGLFLLDPVCDRDAGFHIRTLIRILATPVRYALWFKRRLMSLAKSGQPMAEAKIDRLAIRNYPNTEAMREAFEAIRDRQGRVLSVFTSYATVYLNQAAQLNRVLRVQGFKQFCTALFWPGADHPFSLELHRAQLIETVRMWAEPWLERQPTPAPRKTAPSTIRMGVTPIMINRSVAYQKETVQPPVHNTYATSKGKT
jgi:hypothetical protein